MDEITLTGATTVSEIRDGAVTTFTITPEQFGMKRVSLRSLRGGSGGENAKITRAILDGTERGAKRDIVSFERRCNSLCGRGCGIHRRRCKISGRDDR